LTPPAVFAVKPPCPGPVGVLLAEGVLVAVPVPVVETDGDGDAVEVGNPVGKELLGVGVGVTVGQPLPATGNVLPRTVIEHLGAGFLVGLAFGSGPIWFHSCPLNCGLRKLSGVRFANSAWAKVFQMFAGQ
jgi:hypothetical protein